VIKRLLAWLKALANYEVEWRSKIVPHQLSRDPSPEALANPPALDTVIPRRNIQNHLAIVDSHVDRHGFAGACGSVEPHEG
jgi:hypothetical protein